MRFSTILIKTKIGGARVNDSLAIAEVISKVAVQHGFRVIRDVADVVYPENTVMIPIGGDGTVLHGAKEVINHSIPIIGINVGNLGFLTDLSPTQSDDSLNAFFQTLRNPTHLKEDKRTVLSVTIGGIQHMAMNDIVISDLYSDAIIEYELIVGSSSAGKHKANSLILSTPTGSTAYAMFAGGAIIEPDLDVVEIIPVAAMSMTARPMIVHGSKTISVKITNKPNRTLSIKADGVSVPVDMPTDDKSLVIDVTRMAQKVTLLHSAEWNFFDVLSNKLNWYNGK